MAFNAAAVGHDTYDTLLDGSVSEYFEMVDECIKVNEEMNGAYRLVHRSHFNNDGKVEAPGFTHVDFSVNGTNITDIDNSYMNGVMSYKVHCNKTIKGTKTHPIFISFSLCNSLAVFKHYYIQVNGKNVVTQNYVGEIAFLQQAALNDLIRDNSPFQYTSSRNSSFINKPGGVRCVVKIDKTLNANTDLTIIIPYKITLDQFIELKNLKMLPSFMGRWEIELYPTGDNLEVRQISEGTDELPFTQIGDPFTIYNWTVDESTQVVNTEQTDDCIFTYSQCVLEELWMDVASFTVRSDVFNALRMRYISKPWVIPSQTLQFARMSGPPNTGAFSSTLSTKVENLDSMFVLFPRSSNQHTCFFNPKLKKLQITAGEFGNYPIHGVDTVGDTTRCITTTMDALNLADSDISAMNRDLLNSLIHEYRYVKNDETSLTTTELDGDKSKWLFGVAMSRNGFQNGISSPNANINFVLTANREDGFDYKLAPTILFLVDNACVILCYENSDIPSVNFTSKSVC